MWRLTCDVPSRHCGGNGQKRDTSRVSWECLPGKRGRQVVEMTSASRHFLMIPAECVWRSSPMVAARGHI